MIRSRWWAGVAAACLMLAAAARVEAQRVSFTLQDVRGGDAIVVAPGALPTLVAVFATWCRSCKDEVAIFNTLAREFTSHGVRVVALSADDIGNDRLGRWLDAHKATYAAGRDTSGMALRALGAVGVPELYLIDNTGRITYRRRGPVHAHLAEIRAAVASLK